MLLLGRQPVVDRQHRHACRDGEAVRLTTPHKTSDKAEQERILAAGGWLTGTKTKRVNGVLGVARSLGDVEYKV